MPWHSTGQLAATAALGRQSREGQSSKKVPGNLWIIQGNSTQLWYFANLDIKDVLREISHPMSLSERDGDNPVARVPLGSPWDHSWNISLSECDTIVTSLYVKCWACNYWESFQAVTVSC